jgi:hypothetical protein
MALKLNIQPRKPSGPVRDSNRYTTSPTTTEGKASKVLSTVSSASRPAKRATASHAPSTRPSPQASRQAVALTASERPTMVHSHGSKDAISASAVAALSEKVDMAQRRAICGDRVS